MKEVDHYLSWVHFRGLREIKKIKENADKEWYENIKTFFKISFLYIFYLFWLDFTNKILIISGEDPRNNKSTESGLTYIISCDDHSSNLVYKQ